MRTDPAILIGLVQGADALSASLTDPQGKVAALALQAALTIALGHVRPYTIPGAREAALRDLGAALAVLRGDDDGTSAIPTRYDTGTRETLDRIRDLLGDRGFAAGCLFNVVKYLDRAGKKGDAALDQSKALFYLQAAAHVLLRAPDPRAGRPTFRSYRYVQSAWPSAVLDLAGQVKTENGAGESPVHLMSELLTAYEGSR